MSAIEPGAMLGVLGGGQLGRMFALAARRMGYRVSVFAPGDDTPAGQLADREVRASYDDLAHVAEFARGVSVVTYEFENVPSATMAEASQHAPERPSGALLHTTQDRAREKAALVRMGIPVAEHAVVAETSDLHSAASVVGGRGVLKTSSWGYDGKGQVRVDTADALESAWDQLGREPCVFERWMPFEKEISVVGARGVAGDIALYRPFENDHEHHILDTTTWPAAVPDAVETRALELARQILVGLDVVGVLCVEMFLLPDGEIRVNELAPRPHNSGHLTIDACETSQFEQQVRAVCGLPLGSTAPRADAAAMANLLGDLWRNGEPDWASALAEPGVSLHLYGKEQPKPGRKMGHLTATGTDVADALRRVREARRRLARASS